MNVDRPASLHPSHGLSLGVIVLLLVGAATVAAAQGAPYYKWRSKLDGKVFCLQVVNGEGWKRISGPYRDSRCERPL
jgi:hypothetical protein